MSEIEARKTIIISQDCKASEQWDAKFFVPFKPDEMIIRSVVHRTFDNREYETFLVWSDLIGDVICSAFDGCNYCPQTVFVLKKDIGSQSRFQIQNVDGSVGGATDGKLAITIEFIKYKSEKVEMKKS